MPWRFTARLSTTTPTEFGTDAAAKHNWAEIEQAFQEMSEKGVDALEEAPDPEAVKAAEKEELALLTEKVKEGCLDSTNALGDCYRKGKLGVAVDFERAASWYKQAAMKTHAGAQYNLGLCYFTGKGAEIDDQKCAMLLQEATRNGSVRAQSHLAQNYLIGQGGVKQDEAEGVRLLRLAAHAGEKTAQLNLGNIYYHGLCGVKQNRRTAKSWFVKSAEQQAPLAFRMLGIMHERGHGVARSVKEAHAWYFMGAQANDAVSQYQLSQLCQTGDTASGVPKNQEMALFWLEGAAKQKFQPAVESLEQIERDQSADGEVGGAGGLGSRTHTIPIASDLGVAAVSQLPPPGSSV